MILHALQDFYVRKADEPGSKIAPLGWEHKEIPFIIVLSENGDFVGIEDTREGEGKSKRAKSFLVPQGVKRSSGIKANLLWDVAGYVFGLDLKGNPRRALEQKEAFIDRLEAELGDLPIVQRIVTFLRRVSLEELKTQDSWDEIVKTNPNLSFRFRGSKVLICRHPDVVAKLASNQDAEDGDRVGTCLITGQPARIKTLHTAIKGVYGAQTTGANIVSFNLDAFRSYGKTQGKNAPVGSESEFAYTTALNTLLRRESKQKLLVGDATTVFWSKEHTSLESDFAFFFEEPPKTSPDSGTQKIKALFDSLHSGAYVESDADIPFYILGLSPNASRISIRFWQEGTVSDIAVRIKRYFEDFAIIKPPHEPKYYSVWRILVNTATQDKSENIPPNVAGAFMQSILTGAPYPATLLQAVLRRIKSDPEQRVKPVRAALIKAYLNRYYEFYPSQHYKEVGMELDSQQPSIGYQLGRLFAVLEKIQEEANPGLNATIRERYYGAACATPVTVFANLLRLKNHHLAKMENKGRVVNLERLLGEIISNITSFPAHLNLHEQGHFAIGYYHQRQAFFTKKEKTEIA